MMRSMADGKSIMVFRSIRRGCEASILSLRFANRQKIERFKNAYQGQSAFIVGNAPSLKELPLDLLFQSDIPFFMVNNGVRLAKNCNIPFHVVCDPECFLEYSSSWQGLPIQHAFYRNRFTRLIPDAKQRFPYPVTWLPYRSGGILKRNFQTNLALGLGNDSNVICFTAQVCFYLGFQNVYIIGCDLTYTQGNEYAYEQTEADRRQQQTEKTKTKRKGMKRANAEFEIIHQIFTQHGRSVFNCGVGGNLNTIPRLPFEVAIKNSGNGKK